MATHCSRASPWWADPGLSTRQVTKLACPPLLGVERADVGAGARPRHGQDFNTALLQELKQENTETGRPCGALVHVLGPTEFTRGRRVFLVEDQSALDVETSREVLARGLGRTVDAITALGIRVLLIGQPPEFFQDPNVCFVQRSMFGRDVNDCIRQPRQVADQRLHASKAILQDVATGRSATTYVGLDSILCDEQACRTWEDGQPLYGDRNHLNLYGARVVGEALAGDAARLAPLFSRNALAKVSTEESGTNSAP